MSHLTRMSNFTQKNTFCHLSAVIHAHNFISSLIHMLITAVNGGTKNWYWMQVLNSKDQLREVFILLTFSLVQLSNRIYTQSKHCSQLL